LFLLLLYEYTKQVLCQLLLIPLKSMAYGFLLIFDGFLSVVCVAFL